jgi:hypothetical protein
MGRPAGWMQELTGRAPMKSPGKPSLRRDVERRFWCKICGSTDKRSLSATHVHLRARPQPCLLIPSRAVLASAAVAEGNRSERGQ